MKGFFSLLVLLCLVPIYPQVSFDPYTFNGNHIQALVHTGVNTYYFTSGPNLMKTNDYFHTFDTLFIHPTSTNLKIFIDTAQAPYLRLIVFPYSPNYNGQQYYSIDSGNTWAPFNGATFTQYAFAGDKLYALSDTSINLFCSIDTGQTWSQIILPQNSPYGNIYNIHRDLLTTENNGIYVFGGERYPIEYPDFVHNLNMYYSSNSGQSWQISQLFSFDPIWWRVKRCGKDIILSPAANTTSVFNVQNSQMKIYNTPSDNGCIESGNIFLAKWDFPPEAKKISMSTDSGVTWSSYPISFYMPSSIEVDEYGFFYYFKNYSLFRSTKPFYKYLSKDSLNITTPIDTTIKVTIYNPLKVVLPLDSIVTGSSVFTVKNFTPLNLQPNSSVTIDIEIKGNIPGNHNTVVKLYFRNFSLNLKLQANIINTINEESTLNEFLLSQNFPNPFNPNTTIKYSIPSRNLVQLTVFNILGQQVSSLINEIKEKGEYSVDFLQSGLPNGVYFYRLEAGEFRRTMKMILLK